jgi:hypothetical protein
MTESRDRDYPIEEYMAFQRREWIAERVGWSLQALVAVVALVGLLGYGPLSKASVSDAAHRLSVEFERFQRATVTGRFTFRIASPTEPLVLHLGPSFASQFEIDSLQPMPIRSTQSSDGLLLTFAPPPSGDFTVVLWCRPRHIGFSELRAALGSEPPLTATILVYP